MKDKDKTKEQLINELVELRQRVTELEAAETERKRVEEALRESEARYRILFEQANDAIHIDNEDDEILDVNRRACEMLGYSREELLNMTVPDLKAPEVRGQPGSVVKTEFARYGNAVFETLNVHRDGTRIPVEVSVSKVEGLEGDLYISIVRDITERKRAEEEIRQRTVQLETLREVGLELTAQLDLDALLRSIVSRAVELLGGTSGGLYLYRPEEDVLEWVVAIGPNLAPTGSILRRGEGLSGRVWESGSPLIVDDYQHWEGRPSIYKDYPFKAVVGVPVRWGEEFLGVLDVLAEPPRTFSPTGAELLSLFATQAAIAIRNVRLYEAERKRATQLAVVNQVARQVVSILELDQLLQKIVTAIQQGFGYYNAVLLQLGATATELGMQAIAGGFEDVTSPDYRQAVGVGLIGWTAETGRPLLVNDVSQDPRYIPGFLEEALTKSELCVPLKLGDRVIGVLDIQETRLNAFDEMDLMAMEILADQIAVAIENARLYEQAQRDAETKSMLLREVNHRVKNNLSAIIGLLYAEQRYAKVEDPSAYQAAMKELASRVHGLATVHDMLSVSEWAPLPLDELTRRVIHAALRMLPRDKYVSVDVTPSPVRVTSEQANDLALVINELTTNTVKYALQERDTVHISVRIALEDDLVLFEFRNDGPGYPAEVLQLERHSVGLYLMQTLVSRGLRGELALRSDRGAVTTIRFKKDFSGL